MIFRGFLGLFLLLASASAGGYGPGGSLGSVPPSAIEIAGRPQLPGIGLVGQGSVIPGAGSVAGRNVPGADQRTLITGSLTSEGLGGRFGVPSGVGVGSSAASLGGRLGVPSGFGIGPSAAAFSGRPGVLGGVGPSGVGVGLSGVGVGPSTSIFGGMPGVSGAVGVGPSAASFGVRPGVPGAMGVGQSAVSFGVRPGVPGAVGVGPSAASFGGRPGVPGAVGVGPSTATFGGRTGVLSGQGVGQSGFVPYGSGASGIGVAPGTGIDGSVGGENLAPKPFGFEYQNVDEQGNIQFRQEAGDGTGSVQGTYGYVDTQGLYRQVQYLADAGGFRAIVQTNEPGTDGKENSADVQMVVGQTPEGVQPQFGSGGSAGFYDTTSGIPAGSTATGANRGLGPQIGTLPGRPGISAGPSGASVTGGVSGLQGSFGGIGSQVLSGIGGIQGGGMLVGGPLSPVGGLGSSVYGVPTGLTTGVQEFGGTVRGLPGARGQIPIGGLVTGTGNVLRGNLLGSGGIGSTAGLGAGQGKKSGKSGY